MSNMTDQSAEVPESTPVSEMSFEQARDELILVVQKLEQGSLPLATSLSLWERGEQLAGRCEHWLKGARERLEQARNEAEQGRDEAEQTK